MEVGDISEFGEKGLNVLKELHDRALLHRLLDRTGFADYFSFPVEGIVQLYRAARGELILHDGETVDKLLYLVSGRARLSESLPNGKSVLLDFPQDDYFIGEMELLGVRGATLKMQALETCYLLALPADLCWDQLLSDVKFLRFLCVYIGNKERKKVRTIVQSHGYPLINRLADFILAASSNGQYRERNVDAAEYLGVSYRHLQQTLSDFVKKGYLEKQDHHYLLRDTAALKRLADEMSQDRE